MGMMKFKLYVTSLHKHKAHLSNIYEDILTYFNSVQSMTKILLSIILLALTVTIYSADGNVPHPKGVCS